MKYWTLDDYQLATIASFVIGNNRTLLKINLFLRKN